MIVASLVGGILIGASASLAWSGAGQIAGISGLVGRVLRTPRESSFAAWFLGGLVVTSIVLAGVHVTWPPAAVAPRPWGLVAVAGLLVGYGTQLGSGCTSGHGVCGLSRLSRRSLVAVLTFMVTAALVVWLVRHQLPGRSP